MVALLLLDGHARRQVDQERVFRDRSRPLDYLINQELLENCRCDIPLCHAIILFAKLLVPPPLSRIASDQIQSGPDRGSDRNHPHHHGGGYIPPHPPPRFYASAPRDGVPAVVS